jgi:general secretion pathway protein J
MIHTLPPKEAGFTLIELLVALFVFSLISLACVTLLRSSADGQIALKERLGSHSALMRSANLLEADLAQAVPRQVRNLWGDLQPVFSSKIGAANQDGQALFVFTRTGLAIGNDDSSSHIGRVAYSFSGGILRRTSWLAADGAGTAPPAFLITGLQSVTARFRDNAGQWRGDWAPSDPTQMPRAVELVMTPKARPAYRLVMLVGGQVRPARAAPPEGGII